ncbi:hypothetical protein L208DRAFT_1069582, partial [Tricholoma matsutake]
PDIMSPANPCPQCGCMVSMKLAKGRQYPGHHYMHCLSCKNHYVFPATASAPSPDIVLPTQHSRAMKGCAQLSCPKVPNHSCPHIMCKLCCI